MTQNIFKTEIIKQHVHTKARVTKVTTPHGEFLTPAFMPVGTKAFVNFMTSEDLLNSGSQIILGGNTYHMLCTPGMKVIEAAGGMHRFMNWSGPMLTDSGGFQVFSLSENSKICKINEEGAHFRHPTSGQLIHLTPESSIQTQKIIGADIIMAFDHCTPDVDDKQIVLAAMERTHRWLRQAKELHNNNPYSVYGFKQALFGIVQGASFQELRQQSAEFVVSMDLDGVAIGGETIGFNMPKTVEIIDWVRPLLPAEKIRYTMGVGLQPQDLIDVVKDGIDVFDCVAPTRNARHGSLYCGKIVKENNWIRFASEEDRGRLLIKKAIYALDDRPVMDGCECYTCKNFSRAYLHYLFKEKSVAYSNYACIHNIHVMHKVCEAMRECVLEE
jgi:queuine tRNA-ribosyltransferase